MTLEGVVRLVGGPMTAALLRAAGPTGYTLACNLAQAAAFSLRSAGSVPWLYASLAPQVAAAFCVVYGCVWCAWVGPLEQHFLLTSILQVLGKQREEAVRALYTRLCIQAGMEPGRMAAAMASWSSVLRILSPLFYSRL